MFLIKDKKPHLFKQRRSRVMKRQTELYGMTLTRALHMHSQLKWSYSRQALCCLRCFVSSEQGAVGTQSLQRAVPFCPSVKTESTVLDTSLISFIHFVSGRCISKMPALPNVSQRNDIPARMGAPWRVSLPKAANQWARASIPTAFMQEHTEGRRSDGLS